ncbi:unnamed protein product [Urochloa humidicola]
MIQLEEESTGWYGDVVCGCRVHDMVLDLIRSISSEENFITTLLDGNEVGASPSSRPGQGKVRRLVLSDGTAKAHMEDMKQVRSFISRGCDIGKVDVLLSSFKFVRVLAIHTSSQRIEHQYLEPIRNLLHLRCLQLSGTSVDLPEKEIAALKFLQTLDVDATRDAEQVAASVGLLTQLRCLRIRKPAARILDGIGKLTSLEELEIRNKFPRPDVEREGFRREFINELGGLRELRVLRVQMQASLEHAQVHMVQSLLNLHKLEYLLLSSWSRTHLDTEMWEEAEGGSVLRPRCLRHLFLLDIIFSRFPSFFLNGSRLPNLSHLYLDVRHLDAQGDLRILGELPELQYLELFVESVVQLVCTSATDDGACLFRKLRRCNLVWSGGVRLLSSEEDSGGVSIRMGFLEGSMLLGSGRNKDVAPTLLPSVQKLRFWMTVQDFKDGNGSLGLEYFASLQNVSVTIPCEGASAADVEQLEAALQHAADVHPNRPTLRASIMSPTQQAVRLSMALACRRQRAYL